jgi:hypothetical protein
MVSPVDEGAAAAGGFWGLGVVLEPLFSCDTRAVLPPRFSPNFKRFSKIKRRKKKKKESNHTITIRYLLHGMREFILPFKTSKIASLPFLITSIGNPSKLFPSTWYPNK